MGIKGIDVSAHNGIIDWQKVKASGIKFAMLRAGYGSENPKQIDKQFERNYSECKRLGISVGAYHYSYAFSEAQAKEELDFFLKLLSGKQFEYPVCYDVEDAKYKDPQLRITQDKLSKSTLTDIAIAFCDGLEKAGYYAALYANPSWLYNHLERERLTRFDLWLAEWRTEKKYPYDCGIWQYTENGKIGGINGNVDLNYAYRDYPTIIKQKGLNGFEKIKIESKYVVTAAKQGLSEISADTLAVKLRDLGMTVVKKEEVNL